MAISLLPVVIAAARRRERAVLDAFYAAGADTPAGAVLLSVLPPLDPAVLEQLLARGAVREGAPGTFYVYTAPDGAGPARVVVKTLLFVLVLLLLPVLLLQFTSGAR